MRPGARGLGHQAASVACERAALGVTRSATEPGRATRQPSRTREDGSIRHNSRRASRLTVQKPELFRGRHALGGVSGVCGGWGATCDPCTLNTAQHGHVSTNPYA